MKSNVSMSSQPEGNGSSRPSWLRLCGLLAGLAVLNTVLWWLETPGLEVLILNCLVVGWCAISDLAEHFGSWRGFIEAVSTATLMAVSLHFLVVKPSFDEPKAGLFMTMWTIFFIASGLTELSEARSKMNRKAM